jgi:hypothetical protein
MTTADLIFYIGCSCSIGSQFDLFICFQHCSDDRHSDASLNNLLNDLLISFAHAKAEHLLIDVLVIEELKSWEAIHSILEMALEIVSQDGYVLISDVHPLYPAEAEAQYPHSSSQTMTSFWLGDSWKVIPFLVDTSHFSHRIVLTILSRRRWCG